MDLTSSVVPAILSAMTKPGRPAPPRVTPLTLVDLDPVDPQRMAAGESLDGAHVSRADLRGQRLRAVTYRESVIDDASLDDADLRGARLLDLRIESASASSVTLAGSTWRDVEVLASRIGAAEVYESSWTSVTLRGCRIVYLNLRGATVTDVLLEDCVIGTLDLQDARVDRLQVVRGRVDELLLASATLRDVDLRGAALDVVTPAVALSGATIGVDQLAAVAERLAVELGIHVTEASGTP